MKRVASDSRKSKPRTALPRCSYLSPSGRRCAQPVCSSHPTLCFTHKPSLVSPEKVLFQELVEAAGPLASPEDVNRVLGKIFVALLEDRISFKKAGTLGFLAQMLLRSYREIAYHQKLAEAAAIQEERKNERPIGWEVPRSDRDYPAMAEEERPSSWHVPRPRRDDPPAVEQPAPKPSAVLPAPAEPLPVEAPSAEPPTPSALELPIGYLNHFYPIDPTLPPGWQTITHSVPHKLLKDPFDV